MTPLDKLAAQKRTPGQMWATAEDIAVDEALIAVAREADFARSHNHIENWRGNCVCNTCKALAALKAAGLDNTSGESK